MLFNDLSVVPKQEGGKVALEPITPDQKVRQAIEAKSSADMHMCWTCGTCDFECPVYLTTERLLP